MNRAFWILNIGFIVPVWPAVNVPLTIQEALYPGSVPGVTRTADPVTVGVPLPDDPTTGITDVNQLTLAGASLGQFRVLGRWPSGRIKWVLVDTQANVTAGQLNTSIRLTSGGAGNFGGSNLAADNGSTITVATGAATFTIRKANFNVVDQVVVGTTTVVASGSSQGLVMNGPAPGQTTCPPCTTVYSSANDSASTAIIEENGPARTVIKATGSHVDAAGNAYMAFTVRMYFYKGKNSIKVTSTLRNADYGTSNTFATAYKGYQSYELRVTPKLSGVLNYTFANNTSTPSTGSVSGSDSAYLYQGKSLPMQYGSWCGGDQCIDFTTDSGWRINKNGTDTLAGTSAQPVQGWGDISNGAGVGVEIGVYQIGALYPKSLEFNGGGTDVRIGIWARQNTQPHYQAWPQYSAYDVYLNFHSSTPSSLAGEFLSFQHYLVARAPISYYNATDVFPYPIADPSLVDGWLAATASAANPATIGASRACCIQDIVPDVWRYYYWHDGGGGNQEEFRFGDLYNFLARGHTGRWLNSAHFYQYQRELFPHSDGFSWRDHPAEIDRYGQPTASSANSSLAMREINWMSESTEHNHMWGEMYYYFLTGDESIKDSLVDGGKDWFVPTGLYQTGYGDGLWDTRAIGANLSNYAHYFKFLSDLGDSDAAAVLTNAQTLYTTRVAPSLCLSGNPAGCSVVDDAAGTSLTRGVHWGPQGYTGMDCTGASLNMRGQRTWMVPILIQGVLDVRTVSGSSWPEYWNSLDLAYGMGRWVLSEGWVDDGTSQWSTQGFIYTLNLDAANACLNNNPNNDVIQRINYAFIARYLTEGTTGGWVKQFTINAIHNMAGAGTNTADFQGYELPYVVAILNNPSSPSLSSLPLTNFSDNGGGSYTLSWTVPAGAQSYRIKWGTKQLVDWLNFNPNTNTFAGNPGTQMPWFAAKNVANLPAPGATSTTQTLTVNTGQTGLTAQNFSIKAYLGGTPSTQPTGILLVGGNGQTGTAGQALSLPFTVRAIDANGSSVAGVSVTFTVTAGGGTLSTLVSITDVQGLASSNLTLGPSAGVNTVTAVSAGLAGSPITFAATGTSLASTASNLSAVSGNGQTGTVSKALPSPFTVRATDTNGNPVAAVPVTFSVIAGGGFLSAQTTTTNAQGLASTTLTLGTIEGANIVTAVSGTLAGSPLTFTATATAPGPAGSFTWTKTWSNANYTPGLPGINQWWKLVFDPVSQQMFHYGIEGNSTSIYSSDVFFYNSSSNSWSRLGGNGTLSSACPGDTSSWPGDRHPYGHMAVDTKRKVLWLWGGICQGIDPDDTYYLTLNPNISSDVWAKAAPAHHPTDHLAGSGVYDPDDDVIFFYGYGSTGNTSSTWVYCPTTQTPSPGALTSKQTAAGCVNADDWSQVAVAGGVKPLAGQYYPGIVYDTVNAKAILYGGYNPAGDVLASETWAYDVPTRTWTNRAPAGGPIFANGGSMGVPLTYNSATGLVYLFNPAPSPETWSYNYSSNTWTLLCNTCGGPVSPISIGYDAKNNLLIAMGYGGIGVLDLWQGTFGGNANANACDLNTDGTANVIDVQIAITQALGTVACGNADLNGDGACNIIDVQRVVVAALGRPCVVGQ